MDKNTYRQKIIYITIISLFILLMGFIYYKNRNSQPVLKNENKAVKNVDLLFIDPYLADNFGVKASTSLDILNIGMCSSNAKKRPMPGDTYSIICSTNFKNSYNLSIAWKMLNNQKTDFLAKASSRVLYLNKSPTFDNKFECLEDKTFTKKDLAGVLTNCKIKKNNTEFYYFSSLFIYPDAIKDKNIGLVFTVSGLNDQIKQKDVINLIKEISNRINPNNEKVSILENINLIQKAYAQGDAGGDGSGDGSGSGPGNSAGDPGCTEYDAQCQQAVITWTEYCTGGNDPYPQNNWQYWKMSNTVPATYLFSRPGDANCSPQTPTPQVTPINGACNYLDSNTMQGTCLAGNPTQTYTSSKDGGTAYNWSCTGVDGGTNSGQCEYIQYPNTNSNPTPTPDPAVQIQFN